MKRTIVLLIAISFGLVLSGCGMMKKMRGKKKESKPVTTQPAKTESAPEKMEEAPKSNSKRIFCSSKKTYKEGTACWHWKRGARKGQSAAK